MIMPKENHTIQSLHSYIVCEWIREMRKKTRRLQKHESFRSHFYWKCMIRLCLRFSLYRPCMCNWPIVFIENCQSETNFEARISIFRVKNRNDRSLRDIYDAINNCILKFLHVRVSPNEISLSLKLIDYYYCSAFTNQPSLTHIIHLWVVTDKIYYQIQCSSSENRIDKTWSWWSSPC